MLSRSDYGRAMKYYFIERKPEQLNRWVIYQPFGHMQKSCAEGAWRMLKMHPQTECFRLTDSDGTTLAECTPESIIGTVSVNSVVD